MDQEIISKATKKIMYDLIPIIETWQETMEDSPRLKIEITTKNNNNYRVRSGLVLELCEKEIIMPKILIDPLDIIDDIKNMPMEDLMRKLRTARKRGGYNYAK